MSAHDSTDAESKRRKKQLDKELSRLQAELIKLQETVRVEGRRMVVLFEGRDAAGKGGVIKRILEPFIPRFCRVAALGTPTERERSQWYHQRYVAHLPAAGEIVVFDRSWYNCAGVERVMGFCNDDELAEFYRSCPQFEEMLIRSGVVLVKYWFSVNDDEQERRFQARIADPTKNWKLSPMDLESRARWVEYSRPRTRCSSTPTRSTPPWWVVHADDKAMARLNCLHHLLSTIDYSEPESAHLDLPPRQRDAGYVRPPEDQQRFVPSVY